MKRNKNLFRDSKNYLTVSKKCDSVLAKRQREEERQKLEDERAADLYRDILEDFEVEPEDNSKTTSSFISDSSKQKSNLASISEELQKQHKQKEKSSEKSIDIRGETSTFSYRPEDVSTNLYLGNIPPFLAKDEILDMFCEFGPIGSFTLFHGTKGEDKKNWAFVGFMCVHDCECALKYFCENPNAFGIAVGRAKHVAFPQNPLKKSLNYVSTPRSRLFPFCASMIVNEALTSFEAKVFVHFPEDWSIMKKIHRFIEFLILHGPLFEAEVRMREVKNPSFQFLYDSFSPENAYYRWKLFSILQGDSLHEWNENEFKMFEGGPIWVPPKMPPNYRKSQNNPISSQENKILSDNQRCFLLDILKKLTPSKACIAGAMVWAIDHSEHSEEVCRFLIKDDTLKNKSSVFAYFYIARLYVVNDILFNSHIDRPGMSGYRIVFEKYLPCIFDQIYQLMSELDSRISFEKIKKMINSCLIAWSQRLIFTRPFITQLVEILGGDILNSKPLDEDIDGQPLSQTDMVQIEYNIHAQAETENLKEDDDIDGIPLDQNEYESIIASLH